VDFELVEEPWPEGALRDARSVDHCILVARSVLCISHSRLEVAHILRDRPFGRSAYHAPVDIMSS
jgi:hypothetical protein